MGSRMVTDAVDDFLMPRGTGSGRRRPVGSTSDLVASAPVQKSPDGGDTAARMMREFGHMSSGAPRGTSSGSGSGSAQMRRQGDGTSRTRRAEADPEPDAEAADADERKEERKLIDDVFQFYDIDDQGLIALPLAIQAWRQFGYHFDPVAIRTRVNSAFVSCEVFGDIIFEEKMSGVLDAFLSRIFGLIDRDGSGRVSVAELRAFLREHAVDEFDDSLLDDLVDEIERPLFADVGFSCSDFVYFVGRMSTEFGGGL